MKNIRYFETESGFMEAYNGDEYVQPWVSFTLENRQVTYSKPAPPVDQTKEYLTFEIQTGGDVLWKGNASLSYSKNNGEWTQITATSTGTPISVSSGDVLKFKGDRQYGYGGNSFGSTNATFKVKGNIMSIVSSSDFENAKTLSGGGNFNGFFYQCTGITDASDLVLPATTLTSSCYMIMFQSCTNMVKGPKVLPAQTLTNNCYTGMFQYCTALVEATTVSATTLAIGCCESMFYGCTGITKVQDVLPAMNLAERCYYLMYDHCELLTKAPYLPATTLAPSCYQGMFQHCFSMHDVQSVLPATALTSSCYKWMFCDNHVLEYPPELPAETLVDGCYQHMFGDCWALKTVKALFTTTPTTDYTQGWLNNVPATGTFIKNPSATWDSTVGRGAVPDGWTIVSASA